VRIFTPSYEMPFAGHPTLGTAWVLRSRGLIAGEQATQVCGAGRVGVRFDGDVVRLTATPRDLVGPVPDDLVEDLLGTLGLDAQDRAGEAWVAGCGLSFVHVPVTDHAVVRARSGGGTFAAYADRLNALGDVRDLIDSVNLYAVSGEAPRLDVHARVFVPGAGVPEDPATGSAAAGLGMALVATGRLPEGGTYDIRQGIEMGRPSALAGRVEAHDGVATLCHVGGSVRPVASGEIEVPELS
jgi:trans-2,3-dihydro-3-hydroxyanthranilate isomerase